MADDNIIKKIARLLDEGLDDRDAFGDRIEGPSQVLSQTFYDPNRYRRHEQRWDFQRPVEEAVAEIDRIVRTLDPDGIEIPPASIEAAKNLLRKRYVKWGQLGGWQFAD